MKLRIKIFTDCFFIMLGLLLLYSCGTVKKKKFLDYFTTYKHDTLSVFSSSEAGIYADPKTPISIRGTVIDTAFFDVMNFEGDEDLLYFQKIEKETGPIAYFKMKVGIGFYLVIIRSGGQYWNSRFYACLYNVGANKVVANVLIAENFGDAGDAYICQALLKKENKYWSIYTHEYFQSPVNFNLYEVDSLYIGEVDMEISIDVVEDHQRFVEKSRVETSYRK